VSTLRPPITKPLLLELYCLFRCHGSEKLGSVCTQNTFTTASIAGTTLAAAPANSTAPTVTSTKSPFSKALSGVARRGLFGRPLRLEAGGSISSTFVTEKTSSNATSLNAVVEVVGRSTVSAEGILGFRPRLRFLDSRPIWLVWW
jgi:hypothetical protein